jgi:hypothetical protein
MVEREVKFRITLDDQVTPKMQEIKAQMDALMNASLKMTANMSNGDFAPSTSAQGTTPSSSILSGTTAGIDPASGLKWGASENIADYKEALRKNYMDRQKKQSSGRGGGGGSGKEYVDPSKQMIHGEWARPLRAVGAYRSAWFAGQDTSSGPMKAAAGLFILQAVADGVKKIVQILSEASPLLRAELKVLKVAMNEMLRPIGDLLGTVLRPVARAMLQANAYARSDMAKEGIPQTDLSEYYARYFAALGAVSSGHEVLGENAVDLSTTIDALDVAFTVLGYTTLPGLINGIVDFVTWFDENKEQFPMLFSAITGITNDIITLEKPMSELTGTVIALNDAVQDVCGVFNAVSEAGDGLEQVLDAVSSVGDIGKSTSDFVSGIGGYFHL